MSNPDLCCRNCLYACFPASDKPQGLCRKGPPRVIPALQGCGTTQPRIQADEWCGAFADVRDVMDSSMIPMRGRQ